jgi:hypothetical protein
MRSGGASRRDNEVSEPNPVLLMQEGGFSFGGRRQHGAPGRIGV